MIRNKIINEMQKENKAISLERFIDICWFNNDGYYESAKPIGKSGDFTTAPDWLFSAPLIGVNLHYNRDSLAPPATSFETNDSGPSTTNPAIFSFFVY